MSIDAAPGAATTPAFRRAVFYVAGFDIVGPRFYHLMFKRGLAQDSSLYGRKYAMQDLPAEPQVGKAWRIATRDGERPVEVVYSILTPYEQIVRSYRRNAIWVGRAWLLTLFAYLRHGILARSLVYSWRNGLLLVYAFLLILGFVALGAAIGYFGLRTAWPESPLWLRLPLAAAAGLLVLQLGLRLENRTFAGFLLSSMFTGLQQAAGRRPDLDAIIDGFARHIVEAATRERWDEILIVGHSSGTMMAIDVAAQIVGQAARFQGAKISLLTLGATDGVVAGYKHARRQRAALALAATTTDLTWIEFHSNRDWVGHGGGNRIKVTGIDLGGMPQIGPRMMRLSVKDFYSAERRRKLKFNPFERHFDYLKSGDRPSRYSFFRIVCAATPLAATVDADPR